MSHGFMALAGMATAHACFGSGTQQQRAFSFVLAVAASLAGIVCALNQL